MGKQLGALSIFVGSQGVVQESKSLVTLQYRVIHTLVIGLENCNKFNYSKKLGHIMYLKMRRTNFGRA